MGRHFTFTDRLGVWLALGCGVIMSAALHAEEASKPSSTTPTRHEIWVPTKDLQEVLKKHPNAVLLDRAQYEALVRDAGKIGPLKEQAAPADAVIEEVKITAKVAEDNASATLVYEYCLNSLKEGWSEVTLPFAVGGLGSSKPEDAQETAGIGQSLLDVRAERPLMVLADPTAWQTKIMTQGSGRHRLRLVYHCPVDRVTGGYTLAGFMPMATKLVSGIGYPTPGGLPPVRLELPSGFNPGPRARKLSEGVWEALPGTRIKNVTRNDITRSLSLFGLTWSPEEQATSTGLLPQLQAHNVYRITSDRVMVQSLMSWEGASPRGTNKLSVQVPAGARVLRAEMYKAMDGPEATITENGVDFVGTAAGLATGGFFLEFEMSFTLPPSGAGDIQLPLVQVPGMIPAQWNCHILADREVQVRVGGFSRLAQVMQESDRLPLKRAGIQHFPRLDSEVVPSSEFKGDLTIHPTYLGGFRFDAPPAAPVLQVQAVPDRFSVDADALVEVSSHEVNILRTLVFHGEAGSTSRAVVTLPEGEVFLEVPVNSGEAAIWKQVGRDIEVTWPKGLAKEKQTALTVRTRRDIAPQAADGSATDKIAVASIPVSGASRVSGYAALKFDESWKVNVTDTTGLETRDARATPVRGRMAWFGLKDWKLGFDLSRRAPVHDATVTAYALPRAKQVEIEGQITVSVTGAPLRKFEVKLPPAIAPLLRVTSPLVGEQSLDAATGVWTFTLGRELMGTGNVRFRISLPAESAVAGAAGAPVAAEGTLTAVLPDITLPGARRMAGRWVVEANTDTELAFATRGVQPIDARRPPPVEGYSPQHRVIAAFSHGGGEHEIRLTATRHDPATLAGMVLIHLRMTSVLGEDGSARHEAVFTLRHNGRQFATIRLPEGAGLLSTVVDGKAVKPVKAGMNEVRLPLASRIGDTAPVEVKVMYDTPSGAWGGSGRLALTPPTLGAEVPVMETAWKVFAPSGFTLRHDGSGLEEEKAGEFAPRAPGILEGLFGGFAYANSKRADVPVDFLPGGEAPITEAAASQRENEVRILTEKLNRIILPTVQFSGVSVEEAVEFLRIKAREHGASGGINMIIKPGAAPSTATISLDLKDVPFLEALRYITELGGMKYKIEPSLGPGRPGAVVVVPMSDVGSEMYVRQFKMPLAHLLALKDKARPGTGAAAPADPFAPAGAKKIEGEVSDVDAFKAQGVPIPEGSMLRYDRDTQTLVVSNTQPNLDMVETVVNSLKPPEDLYETVDEAGVTRAGYGTNFGAYYSDKMSKVIFPTVQFQNATVEEAIEFLRIKSRDYDSTERDPSQKGVSLIIKPGAESSTAKITLDLKDVSMSEALRYITELGGMKYKVEPYAVVVVPISDVATEMYTRTFKVPPTFFEARQTSVRQTAKDVLSLQGIPFPEGASAVFLPATSQLVVRNTQPSLDLIEGYVDQLINLPSSDQARRAAFNRTKSGLVPLELELPTSGQVITLNGHQRPKEFTLHYLSWERQMARTSLLILLGATFFWVLRGGRVWLCTFSAVLLLTCVPILLLPTWGAACHALLLGWLMALAIWLLWRMACWWKRRTEASETAQGREVVA